jgi:hypothetical protein
MKIRPEGAEMFHAGTLTDGRAEKTKLTVVFLTFADAHKSNKIFALKFVSF